MQIIKTPWDEFFFELVSKSKNNIKITSPFVKASICDQILLTKNNTCRIELITSFKLANIYYGSIDLIAIENIIKNNGIVKNHSKLHSKIYLFDDCEAIITSGNLTTGGLLNNYEYGIYINEKDIVEQISEDFVQLSNNQDTGVINGADIKTVKKILGKIPKQETIKFPFLDFDSPEHRIELMNISITHIESSLSGWQKDIFNCVNIINTQKFILEEMYSFEEYLRILHPNNNNVRDKIRQQLQSLRDIGLIEFLGGGRYKKLWI